jgi:hypothetical protein
VISRYIFHFGSNKSKPISCERANRRAGGVAQNKSARQRFSAGGHAQIVLNTNPAAAHLIAVGGTSVNYLPAPATNRNATAPPATKVAPPANQNAAKRISAPKYQAKYSL